MEGKWDTSSKLSDVLLEILKEDNLGQKMLENRAISLWRVIIGPTVVRATKDVSMRDGVMFVHLTSSVVRHELIMLKSKVMESINKAVGENVVTDIVFC